MTCCAGPGVVCPDRRACSPGSAVAGPPHRRSWGRQAAVLCSRSHVRVPRQCLPSCTSADSQAARTQAPAAAAGVLHRQRQRGAGVLLPPLEHGPKAATRRGNSAVFQFVILRHRVPAWGGAWREPDRSGLNAACARAPSSPQVSYRKQLHHRCVVCVGRAAQHSAQHQYEHMPW